MTPQELKNSILQRAIQGKLVEQRPEEGTGEELYQRIQVEKQRLIKAGTIKKENPLSEIAEDDKPFDIPESWKWVRVASITTLNPKNDLKDNLYVAFIPMPCVADGFRNQHTFEIREWKEIKRGFTHFANGDIGVAKITPCFQNRKSVIFKELESGYGAGTTELSIVRVLEDTLVREYLLWFFKTNYFIINGVKSFNGTAGQQRIHKDYLANCLIPLPPLAEQKRIVAKIEELLPYIDRYEQAWSKLEDFNKRFPTDMQKSILQMAIQGKLVEQRPEEGTGEELYQGIQTGKQRLIQAGTIKKDKPLPDITEDEKPFDIPESWKWVRLNNLTLFIKAGGDKPKAFSEDKTEAHTVPVIANGIQNDGIIGYTQIATVDEPCITVSGRGTIGFSCIRTEPFCPIVRLLVLNFSEEVYQKYIQIVLNALLERGVGTSIQQLTVPMLEPKLIPLPPLAEQKRIVAKLEEILPLCKKLKK